jgi:uncharacterized protein Yka (UPF0111/DUF47 family)
MWIDRAVKWLLPRETHFFDLIERGAARAYEISGLLVDCCAATSHADREAIVARIHKVEHEADRVIADVYEALNRTFVTPLDRSDIYSLAVSLEEVADAVFATALQFVVHAMEDLPEGSRELAALVLRSCEVIQVAVPGLRDMKNAADIRERCELLDSLESEGDRIYRTQLAAMFRTETDAIRLIKHKEFLEGLERTLDACEDVGGALRTIVIKNA